MADAPDLSAITTGFFEKGPVLFRNNVNAWNIADQGIAIYKNVKAPIVLPKLSAKGNPRPYSTTDHSSGNGFSFGDRTLTVYQTKWDYTFNPEEFRNTYLNDGTDKPYYEAALDQISKEYLAAINNSALGHGTYNASGSTAASMMTGFLILIQNAINASSLSQTTVGAITSSNAVTQFEKIVAAMPAWMYDKGARILCSWQNFNYYMVHYRTLNGYGFNRNQAGQYSIDGHPNILIQPCSWLGTSPRLIATVDGNLVVGTDGDGISVSPSIKFDQVEVRLKMPIGCQIADLSALLVNDVS